MAHTPLNVQVELTPEVQRRLDSMQARYDEALKNQRAVIDRLQTRQAAAIRLCQEAAGNGDELGMAVLEVLIQ